MTAIYHYISGNAPVTGKKTQERKNILAILKHWSLDAYAILQWHSIHWHSFVMGGIDNDSLVEAGIREIKEETGYINIEYVTTLSDEFHCEYYAPHKDINRYSIARCAVYQLHDSEQHDEALDDDHHTLLWVPVDKVERYLSDVPGKSADLAFWYQYRGQDKQYKDYVGKMKQLSPGQ